MEYYVKSDCFQLIGNKYQPNTQVIEISVLSNNQTNQ